MLIVCPTPIGNLKDISERQIEAIRSGELLACEDTRRTGRLLELLGIDRKDLELVSYHDHSGRDRLEYILEQLERGCRVIVVSDAGTPGLSDPGYRIVSRAVERGIEVSALPGPNAAITALSASGLPTDSYLFGGFAPKKTSDRRTFFENYGHIGVTLVLYESPKRLTDFLGEIRDYFGADKSVCVARELTKMHEEYVRGSIEDVSAQFKNRDSIRGEFVVLIAPADERPETQKTREIEAKIEELIERGLSPRSIKEIIPELYDHVSRSDVYDRVHKLKDD